MHQYDVCIFWNHTFIADLREGGGQGVTDYTQQHNSDCKCKRRRERKEFGRVMFPHFRLQSSRSLLSWLAGCWLIRLAHTLQVAPSSHGQHQHQQPTSSQHGAQASKSKVSVSPVSSQHNHK
jgi:hypothetical protein